MTSTNSATDDRSPSLEDIRDDLQVTAAFYASINTLTPGNDRNFEAGRICAYLAQEVATLEGTSALTALRDAIEGLGDDRAARIEFDTESLMYRQRIGFDHFPATITDYVVELEKIASKSVRFMEGA